MKKLLTSILVVTFALFATGCGALSYEEAKTEAETGNLSAMFQLASYYSYVDAEKSKLAGVEQDYVKALALYKIITVEDGSIRNGVARYRIAKIYETGGYGVEQDKMKAIIWHVLHYVEILGGVYITLLPRHDESEKLLDAMELTDEEDKLAEEIYEECGGIKATQRILKTCPLLQED